IRAMMARETGLRLSAESRLSDALETSREGVILVAADGTILLANRQLGEFFPAIAAELVPGTNFNDALRLIGRQLAAGEDGGIAPSGHRELELADGRWVRMTAKPTRKAAPFSFSPISLPSRNAKKICAPPSRTPKPPTPPRRAFWPI